jgi:hypothetical protein
MIAPETVYLNDPEFLLVVFDLREPGAAESLHQQRAVLAGFADIEALDEDHFALIFRPGWLLEQAT